MSVCMPDSAQAGWDAWDFTRGFRLEPNGSGPYRQRHPGRPSISVRQHQVPAVSDSTNRSGSRRAALRRHYRQRRRDLDPDTQAAHAAAIVRHFFTAGLNLAGRSVGLYVASDGEPDLAPLQQRLLATRKRVALPVVHRDGRMAFYRVRRRTPMIVGYFGIPEPAPGAPYVAALGLDVLLMPLVAFDDRGNRLGRGAGYYDRYLARLPSHLRPRLIGVAHELQRSAEPLPAEPWDVPLHGVLTEAGWRPLHR
jgi:5-formyltetrahydrofolate cyclo-ligase